MTIDPGGELVLRNYHTTEKVPNGRSVQATGGLCTILTADGYHFDVKKLPKVTEALKLAITQSGLQTKMHKHITTGG